MTKNCCVNPTLPKESQICEFSSLFVNGNDINLYINDLKEFENHIYCSLHNPSATKQNYAGFLQKILDNFLSRYQISKSELNFDYCFFNEITNFYFDYTKDSVAPQKSITLNFKNSIFMKDISISKSGNNLAQIGCHIMESEIKGDVTIQNVNKSFLIKDSSGNVSKVEIKGFCNSIEISDNSNLEIEALLLTEENNQNEPPQATKILIIRTKIKKAVFQSIYSVSKKMLFSPLNNDAEVHFGGTSTPTTQKLLRSLNAYTLGISNKLEEIETEEIKLVGVNKIYFDYTGSGAKKINIVNSESLELNGNLSFGEIHLKKSCFLSSYILNFTSSKIEVIDSIFEKEVKFSGDGEISLVHSNFKNNTQLVGNFSQINILDCVFIEKLTVSSLSDHGGIFSFRLSKNTFEKELRVSGRIEKLFINEENIFKKYLPDLIGTKIPRKFKLPINKEESFFEIEDQPNPDNQKYAHEIYCQLMDLKEYLEAGFYYSLAEKYKEWKGNKVAKLYSILSDSGYSLRKPIELYFGTLFIIYMMTYGFTLNTESFYSIISNMINPIYIITKEKALFLNGDSVCTWIKLFVIPLASITQALSMFLLGIAIRWRCRKL